MNKEDVLRKVLWYVNRERRKLGLAALDRLEKGGIREQMSCPISNSMMIGLKTCKHIETNRRTLFLPEGQVLHTKTVRLFIDTFDGGGFPELEED